MLDDTVILKLWILKLKLDLSSNPLALSKSCMPVCTEHLRECLHTCVCLSLEWVVGREQTLSLHDTLVSTWWYVAWRQYFHYVTSNFILDFCVCWPSKLSVLVYILKHIMSGNTCMCAGGTFCCNCVILHDTNIVQRS